MSPVVFPVSFEDLEAHVEFRELAEGRRSIRGYEVSTLAVRHPGGAMGYRFTTGNPGGRSLVYVSDNELSSEARYDDTPGWRERLVEFVRGASVLVHDTMYTSNEYGSFVGWGHSTHDQAVELALDADVERLVLFHHRPERSDDEVDRCVERCRAAVARRGRAVEVLAAAEGMSLQV
jgi:ribonuclease BN (tRNA processing enzyme)